MGAYGIKTPGARGPKSPPKPTRERMPLWEALGSEAELKAGKMVWVMFRDAIARIELRGPWVISRRGPQLLDQISRTYGISARTELHVLTRDGVVSLQHATGDTAIALMAEIITGEHVIPGDPSEKPFADIVRVTR